MALPLRFIALALGFAACGSRPVVSVPDAGPTDPPQFVSIDAPVSAAQYARYEISFAVTPKFENPFDPRQADIVAELTGPDGATATVPAFYYQAYDRGTDPVTKRDTFTASGDPGWKVRFAPDQVGDWTFRLVITDSSGAKVKSVEHPFTVARSEVHGFIRQSPVDAHWFVFDDGTPYFGAGENIAWGDPSLFENHLSKLATAGGNFVRVWMTGFDGYDLEWANGIGNYDLVAAFKLDQVLETAEANGIAVMLCMIDHGKFSLSVNAQYQNSPYRASRGGPLPDDDPNGVWTNPEAIASLQRVFRYLIARYGYSTALHSWEFWNEMEWVGAKPGDFAVRQTQAALWHQVMALFFKTHDPYHHLLTTSLANASAYQGGVFLPLSYAQTHLYVPTKPAADPALAARATTTGVLDQFGMPMVTGEFGITLPDDLSPPLTSAQKAEAVRRGGHGILWASLVGRASSAALIWDWETMDAQDLYSIFTGISRFTAGEHLAELGPVSLHVPASSATAGQAQIAARVVPGYYQFDKLAPSDDFTLDADGALIPDVNVLHRYLFASGGQHDPPTFRASYTGDGRFDVTVNSVSSYGTAKLTITLDGAATSVKDTVVTAGATVGIQVPAGAHVIKVDSTGSDWIQVDSYAFTWLQSTLRARVLKADQRILGWLEDRNATFTLDRLGVVPAAISDGMVTLDKVADGDWTIEWWDTVAGKVVSTNQATAKGGLLTLAAPAFSYDMAFKAAKK
jgi:hypothetical protein